MVSLCVMGWGLVLLENSSAAVAVVVAAAVRQPALGPGAHVREAPFLEQRGAPQWDQHSCGHAFSQERYGNIIYHK